MNRESQDYELAKKKVEKKKGFYQHLTTYVSVIGVLALINLFTTPGRFWFIFPALAWGISIAIHYFSVFGIPGGPDLSEEWEEAEIEAEMERMRRHRRHNTRTEEDVVPNPEEELELKEFKKLRKEWDDSDFV
ncbi:MAG: 2TM domain-containing protein [Bacteroidota bacterium]